MHYLSLVCALFGGIIFSLFVTVLPLCRAQSLVLGWYWWGFWALNWLTNFYNRSLMNKKQWI